MPQRMAASRTRPLVVGDLFCGAGGFAEGFRQAGFRVAWGVDLWAPAVETFHRNFPEAEAIRADVLGLSPRTLPPVDVVIGSPPCVHFSPANRGGNGDKETGMTLVHRFLEFVSALGPKYWIMENVPALRPHLEARMNHDDYLHSSLRLSIPTRVVLDAASYGTPQSRRRLFSGEFTPPAPFLEKNHRQRTLRDVVEGLPDPTTRLPARRQTVKDPVYEQLSMDPAQLRDHFEDPRWAITEEEVLTTRERREHDRIYGVMPFPDGLDRPSRTITATKTRGSRATIVIPWPSRTQVPYRTLTLRECASAQGFPLTFQFWAGSMSAKDALVGNAVPPPVARAIGAEILSQEGQSIPSPPVLQPVTEIPPTLTYRRIGPRRFSMRRRFRGSVSIDWRHDHRVELDNELPVVAAKLPPDVMPPVTWRTRLYLGYATQYRCYEVRFPDALILARALAEEEECMPGASIMKELVVPMIRTAIDSLPDGIALQEEWSGWRSSAAGPHRVLSSVAHHVGRALPGSEWTGKLVPLSSTNPTLRKRAILLGDEANENQPFDASVRLIASTVCLALVCERLNVGPGRLQILQEALATRRGMRSKRIDRLAAGRGVVRALDEQQSSVVIA